MSAPTHDRGRRHVIASLSSIPVALAAFDSRSSTPFLPTGTVSSTRLEALPGKKALIKRSYRPPNYETPLAALTTEITPADQFFVRWHLSVIPELSQAAYRLNISSDHGDRSLTLSIKELTTLFPLVEVTAVCQCSGARRGLSDPHVAGVEWGYGAVSNARWTGVRLRDVLRHYGLDEQTVEVAFWGEDRGPMEMTPRFVKSLPTYKAMDDQTIIAFAMNGKPIPHWNGAPARLIVPGWTATYWMKQVTHIQCLKSPSSSFWMTSAYRLPKDKFPGDDRFQTQANDKTVAVTEMVVNSLITNIEDGQRVRVNEPLTVRGVSWDSGSGIESVEVSLDDGKTWADAHVESALSRYSFHCFSYTTTPTQRGLVVLRARAKSNGGQRQVESLIFNPAGYHNNVPHRVEVEVV